MTAFALHVLVVEDGEPALHVLANGFDQGELRPSSARARQARPPVVLVPFRQVWNEVRHEQAAFRQQAVNRSDGRLKVLLAGERLQDPVRRHHQRESRARAQRKRADITAKHRGVVQPRAPETLTSAREHGRRTIDADDPGTRARHGDSDPARAAPELEHAALLRGREPLPERDVAPRDRLRVLPVVERRVVVPPLPSFSRSLPAPAVGGTSARHS